MTLTFKLDLDILPLDLHTEIQVCMSIRLAVRVRRTHTPTDRQTDTHKDDVKTITPDTSQCDVGCNNPGQSTTLVAVVDTSNGLCVQYEIKDTEYDVNKTKQQHEKTTLAYIVGLFYDAACV